MLLFLRASVILLLLPMPALAQKHRQLRPPIIDVHLHAYGDESLAKPNPNPVTGRAPALKSEAEHMRATLAAMRRYHIVKGFVSNDSSPLDAS